MRRTPATARATATWCASTRPLRWPNWLATDPTGTGDPDVLLIGDYNSYAMEDPITALKNAGFTNLIDSLHRPGRLLLRLRRAVGLPRPRPRLAHRSSAQVTGVADYHINADEPSVLDYNTDFKTANLITTPLRAGPVPHLRPRPGASSASTPNARADRRRRRPVHGERGAGLAVRHRHRSRRHRLTFAWDLDDNGTFETRRPDVTFSAAA